MEESVSKNKTNQSGEIRWTSVDQKTDHEHETNKASHISSSSELELSRHLKRPAEKKNYEPADRTTCQINEKLIDEEQFTERETNEESAHMTGTPIKKVIQQTNIYSSSSLKQPCCSQNFQKYSNESAFDTKVTSRKQESHNAASGIISRKIILPIYMTKI